MTKPFRPWISAFVVSCIGICVDARAEQSPAELSSPALQVPYYRPVRGEPVFVQAPEGLSFVYDEPTSEVIATHLAVPIDFDRDRAPLRFLEYQTLGVRRILHGYYKNREAWILLRNFDDVLAKPPMEVDYSELATSVASRRPISCLEVMAALRYLERAHLRWYEGSGPAPSPSIVEAISGAMKVCLGTEPGPEKDFDLKVGKSLPSSFYQRCGDVDRSPSHPLHPFADPIVRACYGNMPSLIPSWCRFNSGLGPTYAVVADTENPNSCTVRELHGDGSPYFVKIPTISRLLHSADLEAISRFSQFKIENLKATMPQYVPAQSPDQQRPEWERSLAEAENQSRRFLELEQDVSFIDIVRKAYGRSPDPASDWVLAKGLWEYNKLLGRVVGQPDLSAKSIRKRAKLVFPTKERYLGIDERPISRDLLYSARIIFGGQQ